jgi:hypothetical protein
MTQVVEFLLCKHEVPSSTPVPQKKKKKSKAVLRVGGMAQVVEGLLSKSLSSNSSTTKK